VANAQVVGILPGWRYVMLSDRLLETMDDRQIEAVFAHELGHIVHRHMLWFLVFFAAVVMAMGASGEVIETWLRRTFAQGTASLNLSLAGYAFVMFGATLLLMSRLSRRFERQADVFAARMMEGEMAGESDEATETSASSVEPRRSDEGTGGRAGALAWAVGPRGAQVFISALLRVAAVNNLPIDGHDPFHPSIRRRVEYLRAMREDPGRTAAFDRMMRRVYWTLMAALMGGVVLIAVSSVRMS
jgi:STE24 endopeptidase